MAKRLMRTMWKRRGTGGETVGAALGAALACGLAVAAAGCGAGSGLGDRGPCDGVDSLECLSPRASESKDEMLTSILDAYEALCRCEGTEVAETDGSNINIVGLCSQVASLLDGDDLREQLEGFVTELDTLVDDDQLVAEKKINEVFQCITDRVDQIVLDAAGGTAPVCDIPILEAAVTEEDEDGNELGVTATGVALFLCDGNGLAVLLGSLKDPGGA